MKRAAALLLVVAGCSRNSAPPPGAKTGARDGGFERAVVVKIGEVTGAWAPFTPAEGGVTIDAPGVPLGNTYTHHLSGVDVSDVDYFLSTPDRGIDYALSLAIFPPGGLAGIPHEQLLADAAKRHFLDLTVTSRKDTPSSVDDVPALDVAAVLRDGRTIRLRVIAGGDRLIVASVSATPGREDAPEIARFLQSMRVK